MECVSAIDVAGDGRPICVENLLPSANTRCMLLRVLVLSVPTTSVDSRWAIPVLTTAVESLIFISDAINGVVKDGMSSCSVVVVWAKGGGPSRRRKV